MSVFELNQKNDGNESDGNTNTGVITKPKTEVTKPSLYKVILLNDDFTPMEFVVHVLKKFFQLSEMDSNRVMLQVHNDGAGIAGVFTHEVAETKVFLVNSYAQKNKHPLKSILEKE